MSADHSAEQIYTYHTILVLADFLTAELILQLGKYCISVYRLAQVGPAWRHAEYFRNSLESLSLIP